MQKYPNIKPEFWNVNPKRVLVKPFPGNYPTRWAIVWEGDDGTEFRYVGKPNGCVVNKVHRLMKCKGSILAAEFDLAGTFRNAIRTTPKEHLNTSQYASSVEGYYHPFVRRDGQFFVSWYQGEWYPKRMTLGKKNFTVYSQYKQMLTSDAGIAKLREYKNWLRKTNPWKPLI